MPTHNYSATDAEILADEAIVILEARIRQAIAFHEAYEGTLRCVVIDGSQYSPSTRAYPRADEVWRNAANSEAWFAFEEKVDEFVGNLEVDADDDSLSRPIWSFDWEDGMLVATHSDYEEVDDA